MHINKEGAVLAHVGWGHAIGREGLAGGAVEPAGEVLQVEAVVEPGVRGEVLASQLGEEAIKIGELQWFHNIDCTHYAQLKKAPIWAKVGLSQP